MKQTFILCISLIAVVSINAQSIERQLIGVSNGENTTANFHLSWSVGEPFIQTQNTDFGFLTEGILQPNLGEKEIFSNIPDEPLTQTFLHNENSLMVFPNPFKDVLTLKFKEPNETNSHIRILDSTGKVIFRDILPTDSFQKELNLSALPFGFYLIQLTDDQGATQSNIKILKVAQ